MTYKSRSRSRVPPQHSNCSRSSSFSVSNSRRLCLQLRSTRLWQTHTSYCKSSRNNWRPFPKPNCISRRSSTSSLNPTSRWWKRGSIWLMLICAVCKIRRVNWICLKLANSDQWETQTPPNPGPASRSHSRILSSKLGTRTTRSVRLVPLRVQTLSRKSVLWATWYAKYVRLRSTKPIPSLFASHANSDAAISVMTKLTTSLIPIRINQLKRTRE